MQKFILFLRRYYFLLLFVVLEVAAIGFYANSTSYTKAKLLTSSNVLVGGVYSAVSGVHHYMGLRQENAQLISQIAKLRGELSSYKAVDTVKMDTMEIDSVASQYIYTTAKVINNSVSHQQNFFTLDKGAKDGVEQGMAVLSADGVAVGYVLTCSNSFSVCMSVLNTSFRSSGKIKGSDYFGSLLWDGSDSHYVTLSEVSKYAPINRGDTILTTSYSSIFPEDIMVGTVESYKFNDNGSYNVIKVKLGTHISALGNVVLVRYVDAAEQLFLEKQTVEHQAKQEQRSSGAKL